VAKKRRGRTPLATGERKDKLIQTRIDEELDQTLREAARRERVSVSQLIRNVLEDTFELVDNVVSEATHLGRTVKRDAQRIAASARGARRSEAAAAVDAWQDVALARDATCAVCGKRLTAGTKAQVGLMRDPAAPRLFRCPTCDS
jgi:hypothetical protein